MMFRRTPSGATDSPAYAANYVPDTGGSFSSVATGFWQRRRPTCLPCTPTLVGILCACARMIFPLRYSDHITDALASLHRLRVPEHVQFTIAVLAYKVLHGTAPRFLGPLVHVSDLPDQRCFRSASTDRLVVQSFKLSIIGS